MKAADLRDKATLLESLPESQLEFLASVASECSYSTGDLLFKEDEPADEFFIVMSGLVGLELTTPGIEPIVILSLGPSELVGISWMFPPHKWSWTARALKETTLLVFDAAQVREQCEADLDLKLWVLQLVGDQALRRLHTTRVQLLDLYEAR